jgi:hypothetical protein
MTANTLLQLAEPIKFIGRITTMGDRKVIIYIPQYFHSQIKKSFKGKQVKVTIEDAI